VEEQYVGTAYGVMTAVQNTGLATFPLGVSALLTTCTNNPPKALDQVMSQSQFDDCSNVTPPSPSYLSLLGGSYIAGRVS